MESTLYVRCPSCKDRTLIVRPGVRCAACGFDYATLANDRAALDAIVLEQLRLGGLHAVSGIALRERVTGDGVKANTDAIKAMAAANGIDLTPKGLSFPVVLLGGMAVFGMVTVGLMYLLFG